MRIINQETILDILKDNKYRSISAITYIITGDHYMAASNEYRSVYHKLRRLRKYGLIDKRSPENSLIVEYGIPAKTKEKTTLITQEMVYDSMIDGKWYDCRTLTSQIYDYVCDGYSTGLRYCSVRRALGKLVHKGEVEIHSTYIKPITSHLLHYKKTTEETNRRN